MIVCACFGISSVHYCAATLAPTKLYDLAVSSSCHLVPTVAYGAVECDSKCGRRGPVYERYDTVLVLFVYSYVLNVLNTALQCDVHKRRYLYIMDAVHEEQHGKAITFQE